MASAIAIGEHRLFCGDVTAGAVAELMGDERADIVYSDPPWGPPALQMFATLNSPGSSPRLQWSAFLDSFCEAVATFRKPSAPVFLEMGLRWVSDLRDAMRGAGLDLKRTWEVTYGPKSAPRPCALMLFGPRDVAVAMPRPPHGEPVTAAAISAVIQPGAIVLDPCTGLGMTARITSKLGGRFRGTELNPDRLARTVAWLRGRE